MTMQLPLILKLIVLLLTLTGMSVGRADDLSRPSQPVIELLQSLPDEELREPDTVLSEQPSVLPEAPPKGELLENIFGFAAVFGVTGGTNKVFVKNKKELKSAVANGGNHVIIDPELAGSQIVLNTGDDLSFGPNTTLDGSQAPGFKILLEPASSSKEDKIHAILLNKGNGIVHRIHLVGNYVVGQPYGNTTSGIFSRTGQGYWVDHVTISNMNDDGIAFGDNDHPDTSRMVTVSHSHVYDSIKALMFVHNGQSPQGNPRGYTGAYNHIEGFIADRNPYIDGTQDVHWYNNYVHGTNRTSDVGKFHVGGNTTIALFENNFYSNQLKNGRAFNNPTGTGSWGGVAWLYHNNGNETNGQSVSGKNIVSVDSGDGPGAPEIPYRYELLEASDVPSFVTANAGASAN